jgi:hypothetical protein
VEGEPLVDIEAIERRLIGYTSSQAGLVVQDCWHLASALRSARRERDEARAEVARLNRRVACLRGAMSEAIGECLASKPVDAATALEDTLNADDPSEVRA